MSRLTQILRGKKIKPLTDIEAAVKYAIDNAGSGGGGGGSDLPVVTSYDNGMALGVKNGEWGMVDVNDKPNLKLRLGSYQTDEPLPDDWKLWRILMTDVEGFEVFAEYAADKQLFFNSYLYPLTYNNDNYLYNIDMSDGIAVIDSEKPAYMFRMSENGFDIYSTEDLSNTTVRILLDDMPVLPPYSSSEAGKVLGVNAYGELEWVTP